MFERIEEREGSKLLINSRLKAHATRKYVFFLSLLESHVFFLLLLFIPYSRSISLSGTLV